MKIPIFILSILLLILPNTSSHASKERIASPAVSKALSEWDVMTSDNTQLDKKTFELIAIAVAVSQRCDFCVKQHAEAARQLGATNAQIKHAFGVAGYMRMLNATLHRLDIDPKQLKFQGENQ